MPISKWKTPPRSHVLVQLLRLLKAQYPDSVSAIVVEKELSAINRCPGAVRPILTEVTYKGLVDCAKISKNRYDAGLMTYRINKKGMAFIEGWLTDMGLPDDDL